MIGKVEQAVRTLLSGEKTLHDWEHTFRVYRAAMRLCEEEKGNETVVALAALLHDCDDYKIFGPENAEKLTNARRIMTDCGIAKVVADEVTEIIANLGYSKYLTGAQKLSHDGRIVFDADMLDSMGINGAVRAIVFNALKGSGKTFDENIFPREALSKEIYQDKRRSEETAVNHMFEKMLRLRPLMYTRSGKAEAKRREAAMIAFLQEFFREQELPVWSAYLNKFVSQMTD